MALDVSSWDQTVGDIGLWSSSSITRKAAGLRPHHSKMKCC